MNQKASMSIIGAFVVVGLFLLAGIVITYGAGDYFKKKEHYILYFEDSVKGLDVGAPVRFLGVKIGKVKKVELLFDAKNLAFITPVTIEVDGDSVGVMDYDSETRRLLMSMTEDNFRQKLLEKGLRAQLKIDSLLTGKLFVDIGLHPDSPIVLRDTGGVYEEIPTVLSDIAEISKAIENLPIEALVDRVLSAVESVDNLVSSVNRGDTITKLNDAIGEMKHLAKEARGILGPIQSSVGSVAKEARNLARHSEVNLAEALTSLRQAASATEAAMERAEATLADLDGVIGQESPAAYRMNRMMGDVSDAARAIRALADYLERNPNAIVFGKE